MVPAIPADFFEAQWRRGQAIELQAYPDLDHLAIVAPESPLTAALVEWTARRFDGAAWLGNCATPGSDPGVPDVEGEAGTVRP